MTQNLHNIFNSGACPSSEDLQQYIAGSVSESDANVIEQHLENCEMCSDALEGLQAFSSEGEISIVTAELNKKVDELVGAKEQNKIIAPWYKIAAVIALLVMVGGLLFINNQFGTSNEQIFSEHYEPFEKKEEVKANPPVKRETESTESIPIAENEIAETDLSSMDDSDEILISEDEVMEEIPAPEAVAIENNRQLQVMEDAAAPVEARDLDLADAANNELQEDELAVRGGRSNSSDYYIDGVKVRSDKAPASVKKEVEQVEIAAESKTKALFKRNKNKEEQPAVAQDEPIGNTSADAFFYGKSNLINEHYVSGEKEYNAKNYQQAKLWFEKALQIDEGHYQSNFYAGLCALQLEQTNESIDYLNKVIDKENEVLYEAGLWYSALAQIKIEDNRKAKKHLKKIISLNGEYKTRAEELLEDL
ncbi:MAG: hypothetical protein HKO56_04330 [Bacteroidia bacterium]|nr:hypothetical protein [Bacteroidia bacterium]